MEFFSDGVRLSGVLHLPGHSDDRWPLLVQPPGWLGRCCSDVSEPFHHALATAGFAVLSFDYRGWFGSEGPSPSLWPDEQLDDLLAAINYGSTRDDIDPDRIGLFGLGATGSAHGLAAAAIDHRVRCLCLQNVISDVREWLRWMRRPSEWNSFLTAVALNRQNYVGSGQERLVDPSTEIMIPADERGSAGMPQFGRTFPLSCVEDWLRVRPIDSVPQLPPTTGLLIFDLAGDAVTPQEQAVQVYRSAPGPKRLVTQSGVGTYEAYSKNHDMLVAESVAWFEQHLRPRAAVDADRSGN